MGARKYEIYLRVFNSNINFIYPSSHVLFYLLLTIIRRRRSKYSPIFTEREENNYFSIILELNNREMGNQNIFISGST